MIEKIKILKPHHTELCDISDSEYFSSSYSDYISNSKLSLINPDEGGSPEKYKDGLGNNKIYSDAMVFGSAVHQLVLQPSEFYLVENVDRPSGKPGFMTDYLVSKNLDLSDESILEAAKEIDYFHGFLSREKIDEVHNKILGYYNALKISDHVNSDPAPIFLSSYDRYRCQACLDSLKKHSQIQKLLYPKDAEIYNEATLLSELMVEVSSLYDLIKLKFKGKLDNFTVSGNKLILNDLKTTGKDIQEFAGSFEKFHYARQIGLYIFFLKFIYPQITEVEANIIAVQTKAPFTAHVFPISLESIQNGTKEAARLIKMVAFHEAYGYDKCINNYG